MTLSGAVKAIGRAALAAVLLTPMAAWAEGADATQVAVQEVVHWKAQGRVGLEGDSTLHKFSAEAKNVGAVLKMKPGVGGPALEAIRAGALKGQQLAIPVARLASGDKKLDKNMHETLKASEHRNILFKVQSYEATGSETLALKLRGALTIAGVTRQVEIDATAKPDGKGLVLTGEKDLKMTDFGIKPPVMMLGTIRTSNDVKVKFELKLSAAPVERA